MKILQLREFRTPIKMAQFDAAPEPRVPTIIASQLIDAHVLKGIEDDMDRGERISCLFFLLQDYARGYETLIDARENEQRMISNFVRDKGVANWEEKIMEALCLLQNNEILLKLGVVPEKARTMFSTNIPQTLYRINRYAKVFYCLFESLSTKVAEDLLNRVYRDLIPPGGLNCRREFPLELHLLWWIEKKLIGISGENWNLTKLLAILKELNMSDTSLYETLVGYNVGDDANRPCLYDNQTVKILDVIREIGHGVVTRENLTDERREIAVPKNNLINEQYEINNGLVVVFNQMNFGGPTAYEYRAGSSQDCSRILETFRDKFGFKSVVRNDLRKQEIYSELDNWCSDGKKYDCVVVFVLSHGTCGNIVASDGKECAIAEIQSKLCSKALIGKPKILVIQACQKKDQVPTALQTDGPRTNNTGIARFRDLLVLNSTIPGELSVRDPVNGTWLIQILCNVLLEMEGKFSEECLLAINRRFETIEANIEGETIIQVPISTTTLAKKLIFPSKEETTRR